jgi:hypothetical protein
MSSFRAVVSSLVCACSFSFAGAEPPAPPPAPTAVTLPSFLVPPAVPLKSAAVSAEVQRRFSQLEAELKTVAEWKRLEALPEWVHDPKKRVITHVGSPALLIHGFRYTLVAGPDDEVLVVRTGGLADYHDIFWRQLPKLPEAVEESPQPAPPEALPEA